MLQWLHYLFLWTTLATLYIPHWFEKCIVRSVERNYLRDYLSMSQRWNKMDDRPYDSRHKSTPEFLHHRRLGHLVLDHHTCPCGTTHTYKVKPLAVSDFSTNCPCTEWHEANHDITRVSSLKLCFSLASIFMKLFCFIAGIWQLSTRKVISFLRNSSQQFLAPSEPSCQPWFTREAF